LNINSQKKKTKRKIEDKLIDRFVLGEDYVTGLRMKYPWVERAVSSGLTTEKNQSVYSAHEKDPEHGWIVFPTVRRIRKNGKPIDKLEELDRYDAWDMATGRGKYKGRSPDFIPVPSEEAGKMLSFGFSNYQGMRSEHK
jgi:hypothetical protein